MTRAAAIALTLAIGLSACEHVGPINVGEMTQTRATKLAREELDRRKVESTDGWRADVTDYGTIWAVTFRRPPASPQTGSPFIRVSLNKRTGKIVAVTSDE